MGGIMSLFGDVTLPLSLKSMLLSKFIISVCCERLLWFVKAATRKMPSEGRRSPILTSGESKKDRLGKGTSF